jgi:hypothetical protein
MSIEYEDLLKQLEQFRLDVIKALSEQDVELNALHQVIVSGQPINAESLKRLRSKAEKRLGKFQEYHSQRLSLLHQNR